jgi:hypothetical protein
MIKRIAIAALLSGTPLAAAPLTTPATTLPQPASPSYGKSANGVVTRIHLRRFLVGDEERQIVFALGVFDHAGTIPELTTPDGKKIPTGFFSKPSSILISEAFKIRNGLIQQVEAAGASVPYHMHPGWGEK